MKKIKGTIIQFGQKGYGFIAGDDGQRYFVHQKNIYKELKLPLQTRVKFLTESSDKGPAAVEVELDEKYNKLSDRTIKAMFYFLFLIDIFILYYILFKI